VILRRGRRHRIEAQWFDLGYQQARAGAPYTPARALTVQWVSRAYELGRAAGRRDRPAYLAALAELKELEQQA